MATLSYSLLTSESTVQVLSPSVTLDVIYCTFRTLPSGVLASLPVDQTEFEVNTAVPILEATAEAIETIMADSRVIAGAGTQALDQSGLLQDNVVFTIQYIPPGTSGTDITADVSIPITMLNFSEEPRDQLNAPQVEKKIDAVYASLQSLAGG